MAYHRSGKGLEELSVWSLAGSQNCSVDEVAVLFDLYWQDDGWWQPYRYGPVTEPPGIGHSSPKNGPNSHPSMLIYAATHTHKKAISIWPMRTSGQSHHRHGPGLFLVTRMGTGRALVVVPKSCHGSLGDIGTSVPPQKIIEEGKFIGVEDIGVWLGLDAIP